MKVIKEITFDWVYSPSDSRPWWSEATVGKDNCTEIVEHCAAGDGDKWFYDIHYADGKVNRVFNIHSVKFEPIKCDK
jgi:hypothetical protein